MTLDQLRIFLAVAEREHITRAAEALNLTQSAVSSAITALESRHGVMLFDRVGRSIRLNPVGRAFVQEAASVLARAKAAENALADLSSLKHGRLSIMASQTIAGYWLPERLVRYRAAYPGIDLDIEIGNTEQVAAAVEAGEAELGLVEGHVEDPALTREEIATDEMVVVVAPGHPWASMKRLGVKDLAASPWVLRERGSGTRAALERVLQGAGLELSVLTIALTLPGNEAVIGAVEAGGGATFTSRSIAARELRAGLLVETALPAVSRPFYLLRHRERYRSKAADAFVGAIAQD
jgi:DNA-binding transcriptional LysR family regulator